MLSSPQGFEGSETNPSGPGDEESLSAHRPSSASGSRRIEEDIRSIPGVVGCRVVWDREGRVSEIHVVSSGERPAKLVARDVQSLLLVKHDLAVPYQKVSVVTLSPPGERPPGGRARRARLPEPQVGPPEEEEAGPVPVPELPATPLKEAGAGAQAAVEAGETGTEETVRPPARPAAWALDGIFLRPREGQLEVTAYVVGPSGERVSGQSIGPARVEESAMLGAQAVVAAVAGQGQAAGAAVAWVDLAGPVSSPVVVVGVNQMTPGARPEPRWGVGSAVIGGNAVLAGALAALEALGKLLSAKVAEL